MIHLKEIPRNEQEIKEYQEQNQRKRFKGRCDAINTILKTRHDIVARAARRESTREALQAVTVFVTYDQCPELKDRKGAEVLKGVKIQRGLQLLGDDHAVYLLVEDGWVTYVGSSKRTLQRIQQHKESGKIIHDIFHIPCPSLDTEELKDVEGYLQNALGLEGLLNKVFATRHAHTGRIDYFAKYELRVL